MNRKNRPKKIVSVCVVCIAMMFLPFVCNAQISIISALNNSKTPTESVPFEFKKMGVKISRVYGFMISNSSNTIPDKLYSNVQMSEFTKVGEDLEVGPLLYRKFLIPNSSNLLAVIQFGGVSDFITDVLCVVSPSGQVLSTLEGTVSFGDICMKQFRINAQSQIIVSTLTTSNTTSLPLESFSSFSGQRKDATYSINASGQFILISEQLFRPKTYTRAYLDDATINIWQGNENPI